MDSVTRYTSEKDLFDVWSRFVEKWEGGFVNHPNDPGGATNKGVTINTWQSYASKFGKPKTVEGLKNMTRDEWLIIVKDFFDKVFYAKKDSRVRFHLLEMIWGTGGAGNVIQLALSDLGYRVTIDNVIGPQTVNSLNYATAKEDTSDALLRAICRRRKDFYKIIIQKNPKLAIFENGWQRRLRESMDIVGVDFDNCSTKKKTQNI